jgi:predicted PurR-regulated permease PerM
MMVSRFSPAGQALLIAAAFVIIVAGLRAAQDIVVLVLLAAFVATVVSPIFQLLRRLRLPGAVVITLLLAVTLLAGLATLAILAVGVREFTQHLPLYREHLDEQTAWLQEQAKSLGVEFAAESTSTAVDGDLAMQWLGRFARGFGSLATNVFIVVLIAVFLLLELMSLPEKFRSAFDPSEKQFEKAVEVIQSVRQYLSLKTAMSLLTGVAVAVALLIVGLEYALLLGFLAFALNYIPYVGSLAAGFPAILLALANHGMGTAAVVAIAYLTINIVVSYVIEPQVMGRRLRLSPVVVILSLIFWGWVLGPVGVVLAIPVTNSLRIVCQQFPESQWIATLLGPPTLSIQQSTDPSPE